MSQAVFLTGTAAPEAPLRRLVAGRLSATLHNGALRWIRWDDTEILRGILFLVRTPGWGTPDPVAGEPDIAVTGDRFVISYDATWENGAERVTARLRFEGQADGRLEARADIVSPTGFRTNRTGFVVLQPLDGFAGTDVVVEHASGPVETVRIPALISPGQPLFDIRAITHNPRDGLSVTTRLEGDVFEMEDHRNWSDASFKTYSRPIGLPYPYDLAPGAVDTQTVIVSVHDDAPAPAIAADAQPVAAVAVGGAEGGRVPRILIGLAARDAGAALPHAAALRALAGVTLLLRYDPAAGDGPGDIAAAGRLAAATALPVEAELILSDPADPGPEVAVAAGLLRQAGIAPLSIAAFPKVDEASFQPGEARPPVPSEAAIHAALKAAFPGVPAGSGSPAFFTELNRKRPPGGTFDFITHATAPTVHAADDRSVVETLQALPHIVRSARTIADNRPYRIGPTGIGARLNPYGPGPVSHPAGERVGLAAADPRQRGLFAAAWHLGYAARLAELGVDAFAFGAPTGPFGLVSTPQPFARPWWDEAGEGLLYPLWHLAALLAPAAGRPLLKLSAPEAVAALGWVRPDGGRRLLLANLTAEPVAVAAPALPGLRLVHLEAGDVPAAAGDAAFLAAGTPAPGGDIRIGPYGLVVADSDGE